MIQELVDWDHRLSSCPTEMELLFATLDGLLCCLTDLGILS